MKIAQITILPEVELSSVPFYRQVLRGFSQCAFQANELTGLFFVAAVAVFNWRTAVAYVVSVVIATAVARLLRGNPELLGLGLYGFNSGLMGLALANFFVPSNTLWLSVPLFAVAVAALAVAMGRILPFPFLAAPFISMFWVAWPFSDALGLERVVFSPFAEAHVEFGHAVIAALGASLFSSGPMVGFLFLTGLLVSNWRHAVVAMMGALLAASLAAHVGAKGAAINSGFIGFNAVLGALGTYALVAPDLRLAALAALFATWIFSYLGHHLTEPALASGFVFTVWLILLLGWLNPRFNNAAKQSAPTAPAQ